MGADGWYYQSCTETVMPICANNRDDFFEPEIFNLTKLDAECKEKYNVSLDVYKVRMEYGLHDLRAATNVVFSNGDRGTKNLKLNSQSGTNSFFFRF